MSASSRRASRVEVGRRLVEHEDVGPHRQHRGQRRPGGAAPKLRWCGERSAQSAMPTASSASSTRAASSSPRSPRLAGPKATSSRTVGMNSWSSGSWNTMPTRRRISARLAFARRAARRRSRRRRRRVWMPLRCEHERRLAGAVGAEHGDPLAGADGEVDAAQRLGGRRGRRTAGPSTSSAGDASSLHRPRHGAATAAAATGQHGRRRSQPRAVRRRRRAPASCPCSPATAIARYTRSPRS